MYTNNKYFDGNIKRLVNLFCLYFKQFDHKTRLKHI